jgi:hypothetical protein
MDNKDVLASNQKCPLEIITEVNKDVNNDKLLEFSSSIKSKANVEDYSDCDSTYTNADNCDSINFGAFEGQSKDPIRPEDVIQYYSPIFVAGNPQGLRETTFLSVDPANKYLPLVPCNGEGLPSTNKVKCIKVIQHSENQLVDHPGIFQAIDWFKLTKRGSVHRNHLEGIMKKHITNGMENTKMNASQLRDLMLHDICKRDNESSATVLDTIKTKKWNPGEYEFPHKSAAKAIEILRHYGTVSDVPGDGSCGYHCAMLLLWRMKLIDNTLSVTLLFCCGIHDFIVSNMNKFVGESLDDNDGVLQYPWGQMS